jgi:phosphoglycerate dehydrogenase-like enzyme
MQPIVIQTENLPQVCSDWLASRCDLHVCPSDSLRFKELLPLAHGLAIRTYTEVNEEMIAAAPNLNVVGRAGAGVDNIDLLACKKHGVTVVHTPDANTESVVEFVLTTMLSRLRNLHQVTSSLTQKEWNAFRGASMTKKEFTETTLGIIGFGRIGSHLGKMARTLGFNVLFNDLVKIKEKHGCTQVGIEQLLFESDIVSLHVDGRKENKHLCGADMFRQMKPDGLFINAARGFVVDSYALKDYLTHSPTAQAVLDVHDPEPITNKYPLLHLPNATLYPHIACKTQTASINMGWVVKDIDAVLRSVQPVFQIKTE